MPPKPGGVSLVNLLPKVCIGFAWLGSPAPLFNSCAVQGEVEVPLGVLEQERNRVGFPSKYSLATWNLCSDTTYLQEVLPLLFQREDADPNTPQSRVLGPFASAGVRGEDQVFRRKGITFSKHARVVEDGVVAVGERGVGSQPNQASRPQIWDPQASLG